MKLAIFASVLGAASAFTSVSQVQTTTSLNAEKSGALPFLPAPENLAGYVGDVGFDPLRFSDFVPMDFLREAELKHSRICMLATVGWIAVDKGMRVYPVPEGWSDVTSATAHDVAVKSGAMGQLFLWISLFEIVSWLGVQEMLQGSGRKPGDFGFDPLGFKKNKSPAQLEEMELKEITNGRLAMMAFSGICTQAVLTGGPFPYV